MRIRILKLIFQQQLENLLSLRVVRFNQLAECNPRNKHFHMRQKRYLARRSVLNLKYFDYRQCYLLHRISSYSQDCISDHITNEPFITYSVFP